MIIRPSVIIRQVTAASTVLTAVFTGVYLLLDGVIWFSLAITSGTIMYHFAMRLVVGLSMNKFIMKPIDYDNIWLRPKSFERNLYKKIRVKNWKNKAPTYRPDDFSIKARSLEEIIQKMCIAEIGHEIMIVASYFTFLFAIFTNDWKTFIWIFIITSSFAAGFDLLFVIVQRYNRPRLVVLLNRNASLQFNNH